MNQEIFLGKPNDFPYHLRIILLIWELGYYQGSNRQQYDVLFCIKQKNLENATIIS